MEEQLGRFGHHPDPAIDFEVEVEELQSIATNRMLGLSTLEEDQQFPRRLERVKDFRVGGVPSCINAKRALLAQLGEL